ncbi:GNAT family N-acetyltransferase [Veillonella intestinalis]|uniref:GNAT family N-acetyltransferase n=1 Tax=Veillonella intestinalis TaxID=2941341 RepID=UPI00203E6297|nr:N-acetyltransferase [Veillonella intestinalis]
MIIRQEKPSDYETVYQLIIEAFKEAEHSDGNEQNLVVALRQSQSFEPKLSLVAEINNIIVGHILFTKVEVGKKVALALAPLSILPDYQKRGIGLALIKEGHTIAKQLGYTYIIVLGHPQYYPKAGYQLAKNYNLKAPFEILDEYFMAIKLDSQAEPIEGIVTYDPVFNI